MRRVAVPAAVVAAVVVAGLTGWYPWAQLTPDRPSAALRPGQEVVAGGVAYRLDRFEVAASLPAADPGDPPVGGPAGSVAVLVVVTQTVLDRRVALDDHFCTTTLTDGETVWDTDLDFTSLAARPPVFGCSGSSDEPLAYDVAQQAGFSFVVPSTAADRVSARLRVTDGPTLALLP